MIFAGLNEAKKRAALVECSAASVSLLCLLHCLALPLLLLLMPGVLSMFVQSEAFHIAAVAFVVPAAAGAFWLGYRQHGAMSPAALGLVGFICLLVAIGGAPSPAEAYYMAAGSAILVAAHVLNWRLRARAN